MNHRLCVLVIVLLLPMAHTRGEEDSTRVDHLCRLEMRDGSIMIGRIVGEGADSVRFVTLSGIPLTVSRPSIEEIIPLEGEVIDGQFRRVDPNRSRLFFGPTARPLRSGAGYFSVYELFFPFIAFGVADVLTISGGITIFPGSSAQLFYVGPKISIPSGSDVAEFALGMQYATILGTNDDGAGIVYGATTLGGPSTAVTLGAGWGFSGEDFSEKPVLLAGFEGQISGGMKIILENWIPVGGDASFHAFGFRFFGEALAADFALVHVRTDNGMKGFPFFPWIGFVYNFGGGSR